MKAVRQIVAIVCLVATFITNAGGELPVKADGAATQPTAAELQPLQGTWKGVMVGDKDHQEITITITGKSLHFHRDTNFWFETTMTLPAGKVPRQLHATIKDCPPSQGASIGQTVRAFFKIEDGTLTLATIGDDAEETPKAFEDTKEQGTRYELRKDLSQKKTAESLQSK